MFRFTAKNGGMEFAPVTKSKFKEHIKDHEGMVYDVIPRKKNRSLSQLGMYRAWLRDAADHSGNLEQELHEHLLENCATNKVVKIHTPKGIIEEVKNKRTSGGHELTMDKAEMNEFMLKASIYIEYPLPTTEELKAMGYVLNH